MAELIETLIEKERMGDSITDSELNLLIDFYAKTLGCLEKLGPHFHHGRVDIDQRVSRLRGYRRARQEK